MKFGNIRKISRLDGDRIQCPVSLPEIKLCSKQQAKLNPTKFFTLVQFSLISLLCPILSAIVCRFPAGNYMFKVNNRNIRTRCGICSKLTIKIPERRHWRRSGIFIVNFKHISHLVLVLLLLTLNR